MTKNQDVYRKQLLYRIHTNSLYKEIKRNHAWQDWLRLRFGVESSKDLSIGELNLALDILLGNVPDRLDFKPDTLGRNLVANARIDANKSSKKQSGEADKKISRKQFNLIAAKAAELNMDEFSLMKFIARQTRVLVPKIDLLPKIRQEDATKIITGLEKIIKFKKDKEVKR